jgi:hypothetical protein
LVALVGAAGCASAGGPAAGSLGGGDPLALVLSAAPYSLVSIHGRDGRLEVRPSADETIRVRVRLTGGCGADGEVRALRSAGSGPGLELRIQPSTKDRCDEVWEVELPARLALRASFDRADAVVDGVAGGVDTELGNGTLRMSVPGGSLRARVEKGDVIVVTGAVSHGPVRLASTVGEVHLSIDGAELRHARPPGAGDWLEIEGSGPDHIDLRSTVGSVRLEVR